MKRISKNPPTDIYFTIYFRGEDLSKWIGRFIGDHGVQTNDKWMGCQGSKTMYGGYPCGLWSVWHALTVSQVGTRGHCVPLFLSLRVRLSVTLSFSFCDYFFLFLWLFLSLSLTLSYSLTLSLSVTLFSLSVTLFFLFLWLFFFSLCDSFLLFLWLFFFLFLWLFFFFSFCGSFSSLSVTLSYVSSIYIIYFFSYHRDQWPCLSPC